METPKIIILADNALLVAGLRRHLEGRFSGRIRVEGFVDLKSCIKHIGADTSAVVIDPLIDIKNGGVLAGMIRNIAPTVPIISYDSREDVLEEVNRMLNGEELYVLAKKHDYKQSLLFS